MAPTVAPVQAQPLADEYCRLAALLNERFLFARWLACSVCCRLPFAVAAAVVVSVVCCAFYAIISLYSRAYGNEMPNVLNCIIWN